MSQTYSAKPFLSVINDSFDIDISTPAQKRALSYASTIEMLFNQVMGSKMPADRIIGQYFRENKKHGSKDRRVIRESLFGLFRWWGWLSQLQSEQPHVTWFRQLSACAALEQHAWHDITQAWDLIAAWTPTEIPRTNSGNISDKLALFTSLSGLTACQPSDLLPSWFWQTCPITTADELAVVEAMTSRPPIWARVQSMKTTAALAQLNKAGVDAIASQYFPDAISLGHKSLNLNDIDVYKQGHIEIQDLASQVIGQICQPQANQMWWDACSGAGGKTLQLRSLMLQQDLQSQGTITSSDIRNKPLEELNKRVKRAGFNNITIAPWTSDALPVNPGTFDGVLVDAPCSCTGTWRRNPDMRWLDDASAVNDKPALQLDILTRSAAAVRSGGQLVYATCSLSPSENEQVVEAFLAQTNEFELVPVVHPFTAQLCNMLTIWPQIADSDGMFVAKMRRK